MNKKYLGIFGIVLMMLSIAVTLPVVGETNEPEILGRTRILAIGTFAHCDDDQIVYGHIFIGLIGLKPVFNLNIEICDETIKNVVMTNHLLRCVFEE